MASSAATSGAVTSSWCLLCTHDVEAYGFVSARNAVKSDRSYSKEHETRKRKLVARGATRFHVECDYLVRLIPSRLR